MASDTIGPFHPLRKGTNREAGLGEDVFPAGCGVSSRLSLGCETVVARPLLGGGELLRHLPAGTWPSAGWLVFPRAGRGPEEQLSKEVAVTAACPASQCQSCLGWAGVLVCLGGVAPMRSGERASALGVSRVHGVPLGCLEFTGTCPPGGLFPGQFRELWACEGMDEATFTAPVLALQRAFSQRTLVWTCPRKPEINCRL